MDEQDPLGLDGDPMRDDTREVKARELTAAIEALRAEMVIPRYAFAFERYYETTAQIKVWLGWAEEHIQKDGQDFPDEHPDGEFSLEVAEYFIKQAAGAIQSITDNVEDKISDAYA